MKKIITILISLAFASAGFGNLIQNGDFEAGNTSFESDYAFQNPVEPVDNMLMWDEKAYTVYSSTKAVHYLWTDFGDRATGSGLMLIVNGDDMPDPGAEPTVWKETVSVTPNTDYILTYYIRTAYPQAPAMLQCTINDIEIGIATAYDTPGEGWLEVSYSWNSGGNTQAVIRLRDFNQAHTGNDFAIDDISFYATMIGIDIDIKPGSYPNALNSDGHGVIPVAILGSAYFNVTQIDVSTLSFAGLQLGVKGKDRPQCSVKDVSGDFSEGPEGAPDGYPDLVCQFVDNPDLWAPGDSMATVTGNLLDGTPFEGSDEITIVPKQK